MPSAEQDHEHELPELYVAVRDATEALAQAERRHSLRRALDESIGKEVRRLVELEAEVRGEKIGIAPLARLDIDMELRRLAGPQDDVPRTNADAEAENRTGLGSEGAWMEITVRRDAIRQLHCEAETLTETKETVDFARRVFDEALEVWEASLRSAEAEPARQLRQIDRTQGLLVASLTEIDEAVDAAGKVIDGLEATIVSMQVARSHTIRERGRLVGGRSLGRTIKELRDRAGVSLASTQRWFVLLDAELDDLRQFEDLHEVHRPLLQPPTPVRVAIDHIVELGISERGYVDWTAVRTIVELASQELQEVSADINQLRTDLMRVRQEVEEKLTSLDMTRWQLLLDPPFATE